MNSQLKKVKVINQGDKIYEVLGILPLSKLLDEDWYLLRFPKIRDGIPRLQSPYRKSDIIWDEI